MKEQKSGRDAKSMVILDKVVGDEHDTLNQEFHEYDLRNGMLQNGGVNKSMQIT